MESDWMGYPLPDDLRSGCKVGWYYYKSKRQAEKAAEAAVNNAYLKEREGFDFGYCCPGTVTRMTAGQYKGLWEVCIP